MSSFLVVSPDVMAAASADLGGIGSVVRSADAVAEGATTQVLAAAGDEVSVGIAELFGAFGRQYQAVAAHAGGVSLQGLRERLLAVINTPTNLLLGRPLRSIPPPVPSTSSTYSLTRCQ